MTCPIDNENLLSICSFNILAPCYKRLSNEFDRESSYKSIWKQRHLSIIELFESLRIDFICLQEFWLDNKAFVDLYQSKLSSKYLFYSVRRTNNLDDGLAIFVNRNMFKVKDKVDFLLNDIGNRVGLLLHVEDNNGQSLLILNIHLTFPHNTFDRRLRLTQMKEFLRLLNEYRTTKNLFDQCSIIICGDFNDASQNDPVYEFLLENEYQSSFSVVHSKEPQVTHLTHRNEQLGVDFIFYQSKCLRPISSQLIPHGCDLYQWNDSTNWNLSDHRAILTTFKSVG